MLATMANCCLNLARNLTEHRKQNGDAIKATTRDYGTIGCNLALVHAFPSVDVAHLGPPRTSTILCKDVPNPPKA